MWIAAETVKIECMDFKIVSDITETGSNRRKPPNYSSRGIQLRLATLIALLGISILAMREAGKPETWERLGFKNRPDAADTIETSPPANGPIAITDGLDPEAGSAGFWRAQFQKLASQDRKLLIGMVGENRDGKSFAGSPETAIALVQKISAELVRYQKLVGLSQEDLDRNRVLIDGLRRWVANRDANEDAASTDWSRLYKILESSAFDLIEDRSSLGRSAESIAWSISWKKVTTPDAGEAATSASVFQLTSQPAAFRGKWIQVDGTAKGIETLKTKNPDLPLDKYHVLWIQSQELSRTPFCVYVRELPGGFPSSENSFETINEPVSLAGVFFKLRSYIAVNDQVETCPLVVANRIQWKPAEHKAVDNSWNPPVWLLTIFFVGLPTVAAWMAIRVYQNTKVNSISPGKQAENDAFEAFKKISEDGSVKSEQERFLDLRRKLDDEEDQS